MSKSNVFKFERPPTPPPPPDDFKTEVAIDNCEKMLQLLSNGPSAVDEALTTFLLINLCDLTQRANAINRRLTFSDDVLQLPGVNDVTDLISKMRNAVCHIRSSIRNIDGSTFSFIRISGYGPNSINMSGVSYGCDYHDDVALYYGPHKIYMRRHCLRAIIEVKKIFAVDRL